MGRVAPARRPAARRSTPARSRRPAACPLLLPPLAAADGAADAVVARLDGLVDQRRGRRRPRAVRRRAAPADGRLAARPRRLGAARCSTPPTAAGLPVLGHLPRHAGDGRARRRRARPAHARTWSATRRTAPAATRSARSRWRPRPGSRLAALVGDRLDGQLPPPPVGAPTTRASSPSAQAADGTLEAMEADGDRFCVAVQWHPETAADVGLMAGLVAGGRGARRRAG